MQICLKRETRQQAWYLDSGYSHHMTGENHMFQNLTLKEEGNVGFGGGQKGKIIGMGTIGNSLIFVNNVWLVSGLKHNLLSISQYFDHGYQVLFNKKFCLVINESDNSILVNKTSFKSKNIFSTYRPLE